MFFKRFQKNLRTLNLILTLKEDIWKKNYFFIMFIKDKISAYFNNRKLLQNTYSFKLCLNFRFFAVLF